MNRRAASSTPGTPAAGPHAINPLSVYTVDHATAALGLKRHTLPREMKLGRLRVSRRAGRYWILGEWLLDWIRKGELVGGIRGKPKPPPARGGGDQADADKPVDPTRRRAARKATTAEREACAALAEQLGAAEVAAAIRARG